MSLILGRAKVLKQPVEFQSSLVDYVREFFSSFSLIKSQLPESRCPVKLKNGQSSSKNNSVGNLNYFIDYNCRQKSDGLEEVVNGELSEEVFNEIFDNEDDDENGYLDKYDYENEAKALDDFRRLK